MKKILLLLLCCALMLSTIACSQTQPEATEAPTDTTTEATTPVEETTEATEPEETEPVETTVATEQDLMENFKVEGERLTEEEMEPFRTLLEFPGEEPIWYNMATTSVYDTPANINLNKLLYAMPRERTELTEAEETFLKNTYLYPSLPSNTGKINEYGIFEASAMDEILQQYFGVTLDECAKVGMEIAVYWDDTDCYYRSMGDALRGMPTVRAVYQRDGGFYDIYYTDIRYHGTSAEEEPIDYLYCLTIQEGEANYLVISNLVVHAEK